MSVETLAKGAAEMATIAARPEFGFRRLLDSAGITVGGEAPTDIQIHDADVYKRVARGGVLELGNTYVEGLWDANSLPDFMTAAIHKQLQYRLPISPALVKTVARGVLFNNQRRGKAANNATSHYGDRNPYYKLLLGETMAYSCAYWHEADNLDDAQRNKMDLVCEKLALEEGMTLLDIGCGWGSLTKHAAEEYGATVTGITPVADQVRLARERTAHLGDQVQILQRDYRDLEGTYDRIVSIGMREHVGPKNYGDYFRACQRSLASDGRMLDHAITGNRWAFSANPYFESEVFPGGVIATLAQALKASEPYFNTERAQNIGPHYVPTLDGRGWAGNLEANRGEIVERYGEEFYRGQEFYLYTSAGGFATRHTHVHQVELTPRGTDIEPAPAYDMIDGIDV